MHAHSRQSQRVWGFCGFCHHESSAITPKRSSSPARVLGHSWLTDADSCLFKTIDELMQESVPCEAQFEPGSAWPLAYSGIALSVCSTYQSQVPMGRWGEATKSRGPYSFWRQAMRCT